MNVTKDQWEQAQRQLNDMDPDALKAQAAMLASMDKATIRRTQPQFAMMSDSEIDMAATQMSMMASNPSMMQMARQQMANMSVDQAQKQMEAVTKGRKRLNAAFSLGDRVTLKNLAKAAFHNGKMGTVVGEQGDRWKVKLDGEDKTLALKEANILKDPNSPEQPEHEEVAPPGIGQLDDAQLRQASEQMKRADPEEMKAQAAQMRSMPPAQLRQMNPNFASMSDAQIVATIDQMEMMANNPDMMKMVREQMENMTPDQMKAQMQMAQNMGSPQARETMEKQMSSSSPAAGAAPPDMSDMMANMDEGQMSNMFEMMQKNPDMIKSVLKSNPMTKGMLSDEQIDQQMDMLNNIDKDSLKKMLGYAAKVQKWSAPLVKVYKKLDVWLRGYAKHVLGALALAIFVKMVQKVIGFFSGGTKVVNAPDLAEAIINMVPTTEEANAGNSHGFDDE